MSRSGIPSLESVAINLTLNKKKSASANWSGHKMVLLEYMSPKNRGNFLYIYIDVVNDGRSRYLQFGTTPRGPIPANTSLDPKLQVAIKAKSISPSPIREWSLSSPSAVKNALYFISTQRRKFAQLEGVKVWDLIPKLRIPHVEDNVKYVYNNAVARSVRRPLREKVVRERLENRLPRNMIDLVLSKVPVGETDFRSQKRLNNIRRKLAALTIEKAWKGGRNVFYDAENRLPRSRWNAVKTGASKFLRRSA